jgi:hypothetical protein
MGFPAAGLASSPRGGVTSALGAPNGSTIGQSTISAPATNPNAPAVGSVNAGLASAAANAVAQGSPSAPAPAPSTPAQVAQSTPDFGSLFQLIASLVSGGAGGPQLSQLAARALTGG